MKRLIAALTLALIAGSASAAPRFINRARYGPLLPEAVVLKKVPDGFCILSQGLYGGAEVAERRWQRMNRVRIGDKLRFSMADDLVVGWKKTGHVDIFDVPALDRGCNLIEVPTSALSLRAGSSDAISEGFGGGAAGGGLLRLIEPVIREAIQCLRSGRGPTSPSNAAAMPCATILSHIRLLNRVQASIGIATGGPGHHGEELGAVIDNLHNLSKLQGCS